MASQLHLEDLDQDEFVARALRREKLLALNVYYSVDNPDFMTLRRPTPLAWKVKDKFKTVYVGLLLCLNLNVDPPDIIKRKPCATLQCWIDPQEGGVFSNSKPIDKIANALKSQYERWQPRARYKLCLDPTTDDVKRMTGNLRRTAKDERIVLHYNGYGCPRPTPNGEIWVFNKNFTQYIPLSLHELHSWAGSPTIYVLDCPAAGEVINIFQTIREMESRDKNWEGQSGAKDNVILVSCRANQILPQKPQLPADIFTSCLTTPIKMALVWYQLTNSQRGFLDVPANITDLVEGQLTERKTPMGELNWIFTAITDTIAWIEFPKDLFQRLFRKDLLLASLFRNFLLAERIMTQLNCNPQSYPELPCTAKHQMWEVWDLALDRCVSQVLNIRAGRQKEYKPSNFFTEQLSAFELWLTFAGPNSPPPQQVPIVLQVLLSPSHRLRALSLFARFLDMGDRFINMALSVGIFPYVLKLLQSPQPDLRSILLFIWVKILALHRPNPSNGTQPTCTSDLMKDNSHLLFLDIMKCPTPPSEPTTPRTPFTTSFANPEPMTTPGLPSLQSWSTPEAQQTLATVVISILCDSPPIPHPGNEASGTDGQNQQVSPQQLCREGGALKLCLELVAVNSKLEAPDPLLLRWLCLCASKLVAGSEEGIAQALQLSAPEHITPLVHSPTVHVRAAAVVALASLLQAVELEGGDQKLKSNCRLIQDLLFARSDASPIVRCELVWALTLLVKFHTDFFRGIPAAALATYIKQQEAKYVLPQVDDRKSWTSASLEIPSWEPSSHPDTAHLELMQTSECDPELTGIHLQIVRSVILLANDPVPDVCSAAKSLVSKIKQIIRDDDLGTSEGSSDNVNKISKGRGSWTESDGDNAEQRESEPTLTPPLIGKSISINSSNDQLSETEDEEPAKASQFFEHNVSYFVTPLLRSPANQDVSGHRQMSIGTKITRNERIIVDALANGRWKQVEKKKIEENMGMLESDTGVRKLLFHPFNNLLISSDAYDGIYVWSLDELRAINAFRATTLQKKGKYTQAMMPPVSPSRDPTRLNPALVSSLSNHSKEPRPNITSMALINPHHQSLLLAATNAGCVHIFGDYGMCGRSRVVSGFRVVQSDYLYKQWPINVDWNQGSGKLCVSSQCNVVTVWDLGLEKCTLDIRQQPEMVVTSMVTDKKEGDRLVLGYTDGTIGAFDLRNSNPSEPVMHAKEHASQILKVWTQNSYDHQVISGAVGGDVKLWDLRNLNQSLHTIEAAGNKKSITALAIHDYSPVFAIGTQTLRINVMNFAGETLSSIAYHNSGWLHNSAWIGSRIPVCCLAFHPLKPWLAAGDTDSLISLYRPEDDRKRTSG